jgi:predicted DNA-binding transcriptional regulator
MSKRKKDRIKELSSELDMVDHMIAALVDVLERKGVLTSEEWEKEVKAKVENGAKTTKSFREIESRTVLMVGKHLT